MTLVENDRVETILTAHQDSPHAPLLRQYRDDLAARGRKPITQQTALTAAAALLATLGQAPLAKLSQRHLARVLRKTPGQRASLKGFLSFVAGQGGPKLTLPPLCTLDPITQERQLRADMRAWRKRLKNPRSRAEARALIALLIAGIYALPLSRVLSLRRDEVGMASSGVVLWPNADAVIVEHPLAASYLRWTPLYGQWVFPGRHEHKPLSEAAVAYHLAEKA